MKTKSVLIGNIFLKFTLFSIYLISKIDHGPPALWATYMGISRTPVGSWGINCSTVTPCIRPCTWDRLVIDYLTAHIHLSITFFIINLHNSHTCNCIDIDDNWGYVIYTLLHIQPTLVTWSQDNQVRFPIYSPIFYSAPCWDLIIKWTSNVYSEHWT